MCACTKGEKDYFVEQAALMCSPTKKEREKEKEKRGLAYSMLR